jgi:hypothetical protein
MTDTHASTQLWDRLAIGLSGLCLVHCLVTTIALAAVSAFGGLLGSHIIHEVGLTLAMILGAFALGRGILELGHDLNRRGTAHPFGRR